MKSNIILDKVSDENKLTITPIDNVIAKPCTTPEAK